MNTQAVESPSSAKGRLSSARHEELPRREYWQNAMRPEDTGYADGLAGIPAQTETTSHFEGQVKDYLNSCLAKTRNLFAQEDMVYSAEIAILRPELDHFKKLLDEKRVVTGRPVIVRLTGKNGKMAIVLATLMSAVLMFVLWQDKGIHPIVASLISLFGAMLVSFVAYPCGLTLRQASQPWQKRVAAAGLVVLAGVMLATSLNMRTPSFELMERCVIGIMIIFAFLTVAACAFLMHDQDTAYAELERKVKGLQPRLALLESQRIENRIFYTNVARRHIELAQLMISAYRDANSRSRPKDTTPAFFNEKPQLPIIEDSWLDYLEAGLS